MKSKHRWFVVVVFFAFMLLHQADVNLIGVFNTDEYIRGDFNITREQMGRVLTLALLVSTVFYPIWGYLYDRYARTKLLGVASFIWGSTTWISAIAPTFGLFALSRASTGIDDSSYPGLYSVISDYFGPQTRGKIYGFLQLAQPLGYLIGMILALMLGPAQGWRNVFIYTGGLGVILAVVIFFTVREPSRGQSEPELADLEEMGIYRFDLTKAKELFKKPTMLFLFAQGFFGVFPWKVITFWVFDYLATERGYDENQVMFTMIPAILILASGYFVGGSMGDWAFKRTPRGRLIVSAVGVLAGAVLLLVALNIPNDNYLMFGIVFGLTAIFIPIASPNMISSVYDITLPEVRSSALSIQYFIENAGAALAPWLAGVIADAYNLKTAFLVICITAWILCAIFYTIASRLIPHDIDILRKQLSERAELEKAEAAA